MGTTSKSGWGLFWFLLGFTVLGTSAIGAGFMGFIAGAIMIGYSAVLFKSARSVEE